METDYLRYEPTFANLYNEIEIEGYGEKKPVADLYNGDLFLSGKGGTLYLYMAVSVIGLQEPMNGRPVLNLESGEVLLVEDSLEVRPVIATIRKLGA